MKVFKPREHVWFKMPGMKIRRRGIYVQKDGDFHAIIVGNNVRFALDKEIAPMKPGEFRKPR